MLPSVTHAEPDAEPCAFAAIFKALSPHYLFLFFIRNGFQGWIYLGGTLLCITGTEAMYADMGHFSKTAIRVRHPQHTTQISKPLSQRRLIENLGAFVPPHLLFSGFALGIRRPAEPRLCLPSVNLSGCRCRGEHARMCMLLRTFNAVR
jgi:hypothetical protein